MEKKGLENTSDSPRRRFLKRLQKTINQRACSTRKICLYVVDINEFRQINGAMGHDIGELVLSTMQRRLSNLAGHSPVERIGNDEFAFAQEVDHAGATRDMTYNLIDAAKEQMVVADNHLRLEVTVGVAIALDGSTEAVELLRQAEVAIDYAREMGASYSVYSTHNNPQKAGKFQFKVDFSRAMDEQLIDIAYQPIVSLRERRIVATEALIRWKDEHYISMSPLGVVMMAESTGLIDRLTEYVIEQSVPHVSGWRSISPDVRLSINVSAKTLCDPYGAAKLLSQLKSCGIALENIIIEVTESAVMSNMQAAQESLRSFREAGASVAIDDFGSGFCSLAYLSELEVDIVKLDQAFIKNIACSRGGKEVVQAVVCLGNRLNFYVCAEGVEAEREMKIAKSLGCSTAQGRLFSKPTDAEDVMLLLMNGGIPMSG